MKTIKHLKYSFLSFIIITNLIAQNETNCDSLIRKLNFEKGDNQKIAKEYYNIAKCYLHKNDDKTFIFADSSIQFAKLISNIKIEAEAYSLQGVVYKNRGQFKKAIDRHLLSLKLKELNKDTMGVAICYNDIGVIYKIMKNYSKAKEYYSKSNVLCRQINLGNGIAQTYNNIGTVFSETGIKDSAIHYYNLALFIAEKIKSNSAISTACNNIGEFYGNQKQHEKALVYFKKCLEMDKADGNVYGIIMSQINIGGVYTQQKKYEEALQSYHYAEKLCLENNEKNMLKDLYFSISENYKQNKNKDKAYDYLILYKNLNDSLQTIDINQSILEVESKYQSEKKDLELARNKAEITNEKNKRYITYGALAFFIILFSIAIWAFIQKRKNSQLLETKNNLLENANQEISHQKEQLSEKQNEILDSINYAKKIQTALLASEEMLLENSVNHFILFKPKDIVSGDFTWATKKDDLFYLACCDSTGHGVPGAFMSLLNIGFLSEAIKERNLLKPGDIFNYVRDRLIETIGKDKQQDGFDGIIICLDLKNERITYAAANNAPLLIRNKEIISLGCNKMPVGKGIKTDSFDTFTLNYQKNDSLYLFTDGYPDQFGGPKGKKFKYKQLKELLLNNNTLSLETQKETLNQTFESWKGNLEQVDDVCVIGIKI